MKIPCYIVFLLLVIIGSSSQLLSAELELKGPLIQGGLIIGKTLSDHRVEVEGRELIITPDGTFVFGLGYNSQKIQIRIINKIGDVKNYYISVTNRKFGVQRIDGLLSEKVNPPKSTFVRIRLESEKVGNARAYNSNYVEFLEGFIWPATGEISGVYGTRRILNGQPRQPHFGVDIVRPIGFPVVSPASGKIVLASKDLYFSGGTLIIDHGLGVFSSLLHLSRIDVSVGEWVSQGDIVGAVGDTGRVTGAHLDWRVNWFGERIDPGLLVAPMPKLFIGPTPMRP